MEALFLQLISELNGSVFVLIAILVLSFCMAYKMGAWKQIFVNHTGRIDNVERIADTVIELKTKVDLIYGYVNPNSPTRASSPISLTPTGQEIVTRIRADEIFRDYSTKLMSLVESKNPKNAYDIQQASFDVAKRELINLLKEQELKVVKEEAFNKGLLVEDVLSVFGILLRNKILELKNIPIAEVDRHTRS